LAVEPGGSTKEHFVNAVISKKIVWKVQSNPKTPQIKAAGELSRKRQREKSITSSLGQIE
jgi:hypothetical protein